LIVTVKGRLLSAGRPGADVAGQSEIDFTRTSIEVVIVNTFDTGS
jgi:hypothetical protein